MKLTLKSNKVQVLYSFLNCMFPSFSRIRQQEYFQAAAMLGICSCVSCTLETCSLRIEGDVVALHWLRTHLEPNHSVCSFKKKRQNNGLSYALPYTLECQHFNKAVSLLVAIPQYVSLWDCFTSVSHDKLSFSYPSFSSFISLPPLPALPLSSLLAFSLSQMVSMPFPNTHPMYN